MKTYIALRYHHVKISLLPMEPCIRLAVNITWQFIPSEDLVMGLHYEIDFRTSRQGLTYPFSFEGLLIETNLGSRAWIRVGGKLVKGLDQYSHSGQTLVQRDRDP